MTRVGLWGNLRYLVRRLKDVPPNLCLPRDLMLARYTIYRRRPKDAGPLPTGIRQDSRWRTKHILRPTQEIVDTFLVDPTEEAWLKFRDSYRELLLARYQEDPSPLEALADLAAGEDVFIGCSCPTKKNPDVRHCHTYLALEFMHERFPQLHVVMPQDDGSM
jgi:hypothetical protein